MKGQRELVFEALDALGTDRATKGVQSWIRKKYGASIHQSVVYQSRQAYKQAKIAQETADSPKKTVLDSIDRVSLVCLTNAIARLLQEYTIEQVQEVFDILKEKP